MKKGIPVRPVSLIFSPALDLAAVGADAADVLGAVAHTLKGGDCAAAARAAEAIDEKRC